MKPRLSTRLPLFGVPVFELSILLVLMAMGFALWELVPISGQENASGATFEKNLNEFNATLDKNLDRVDSAFERALTAKEKTLQDRLNAQEERWKLSWQNHVLNQSNVFKSFNETYTSYKLAEAYLSLADRLETDLPEIHQAIVHYASSTNAADLELHERKVQELKEWLRTHKLRLQSERLLARSQELATNGANQVSIDLGEACQQVDIGLTNYVAKTRLIGTLARNPVPTQYNLRDTLAEAGEQIQHLLTQASQARTNGMRAGSLPLILGDLPQPIKVLEPEVPHSTAQDQGPTATDEVKQALAETENEALRFASLPTPKDYSAQLQLISYAILAAIIGLSLFLTTAIYRRVVVERLRFRLYESTTENKLAHLGQLAAWLAHEIKQPLTAINAWLWTLQQGVTEGMPEHKGTAAIRKEIHRLDLVVKDFLRFTQPTMPKPITLKAEGVLREIIDLLGPQLERQRIRLQLDSPSKAPFSADPQQLKQVLINLVQNAADSIEHDGQITLRARKGKAQLRGQATDVIVIEVVDTGPGIPPEVQQRLFDPFFSTKAEGTGLGLPIAANIIDKHGGALQFKTDLGKGTTFGILLPIARERD